MKEFDSENNCSDDGLVDFLQTYSSSPPSETKPCEDLIMLGINIDNVDRSTKVKKTKTKLQWFWLLPITLVSGLTIFFNHLWQQKLSPKIVLDYEEDIQTFIVDSWEDSFVTPEPVIHHEQEESMYLVVTPE